MELRLFRVPDSAKETFSTLSGCSTSISSGCTVPEETNRTALEDCSAQFEAVNNKSKECFSVLTASASPVMLC